MITTNVANVVKQITKEHLGRTADLTNVEDYNKPC